MKTSIKDIENFQELVDRANEIFNYNYTYWDVRGKSKKGFLPLFRALVGTALYEGVGLTQKKTAYLIGWINHSSVVHAKKTISDISFYDLDFKEKYNKLLRYAKWIKNPYKRKPEMEYFPVKQITLTRTKAFRIWK